MVPSSETLPGNELPFSSIFAAVNVDGFILSLNVTVKLLATATLPAPSVGLLELIVGAVLSNVTELSFVTELNVTPFPAKSFAVIEKGIIAPSLALTA